MNRTTVRTSGIAILSALALAACDGGTGLSDTARIQVLLTDAPADYVGAAFVDIGAVELLPADGGDRIVLSDDGTDGPIDLLDLQGFTTEVLADAEIPAGTYKEIRLFIESASVVLADGFAFRDGSTESTMKVPSGASSGLKLKLRSDNPDDEDGDAGVVISGGETILVVDFDVSQSFRIQGNPLTPAGINGVSFRPVLRVVVQNMAGSIGGTVATALAETSVEGLVVTAESVDPGDVEEFQTVTATALTAADGSYVIAFVAPGTYTVTVTTPDGLTTTPESVEVVVGEGENETGVDFEIVAS